MPKTPTFCQFFLANFYESTENQKLKLRRVPFSEYDSPLRKGYKSKFTQKNFEFVAMAARKPPIYTMKDDQDETIHGKFYQKN